MNGPLGQGIWETWAGCLSPPFLPPSLGSLMLQAVVVSCQALSPWKPFLITAVTLPLRTSQMSTLGSALGDCCDPSRGYLV